MNTYRLATISDLDPVIKLLSKSFKGYPIFDLMNCDPKKEQQFLESLFTITTRAYLKHLLCLVMEKDHQIVAVSLIKPANKKELPLLAYLQNGALSFLFTTGIKQIIHLLSLNTESLKPIKNLKKPHWYIEAFAVSKDFQGQNYGSRFLHEGVIPYISNHNGGLLTLITNTEINRKFYKQNGFTEFSQILLINKQKEINNWSYSMEVE